MNNHYIQKDILYTIMLHIDNIQTLMYLCRINTFTYNTCKSILENNNFKKEKLKLDFPFLDDKYIDNMLKYDIQTWNKFYKYRNYIQDIATFGANQCMIDISAYSESFVKQWNNYFAWGTDFIADGRVTNSYTVSDVIFIKDLPINVKQYEFISDVEITIVALITHDEHGNITNISFSYNTYIRNERISKQHNTFEGVYVYLYALGYKCIQNITDSDIIDTLIKIGICIFI